MKNFKKNLKIICYVSVLIMFLFIIIKYNQVISKTGGCYKKLRVEFTGSDTNVWSPYKEHLRYSLTNPITLDPKGNIIVEYNPCGRVIQILNIGNQSVYFYSAKEAKSFNRFNFSESDVENYLQKEYVVIPAEWTLIFSPASEANDPEFKTPYDEIEKYYKKLKLADQYMVIGELQSLKIGSEGSLDFVATTYDITDKDFDLDIRDAKEKYRVPGIISITETK